MQMQGYFRKAILYIKTDYGSEATNIEYASMRIENDMVIITHYVGNISPNNKYTEIYSVERHIAFKGIGEQKMFSEFTNDSKAS